MNFKLLRPDLGLIIDHFTSRLRQKTGDYMSGLNFSDLCTVYYINAGSCYGHI